jgi:hypothetical protein
LVRNTGAACVSEPKRKTACGSNCLPSDTLMQPAMLLGLDKYIIGKI